MELSIVPADQVPGADLEAVFDEIGPAATCRCQRYRLGRGESFAGLGQEELAHRLRGQTGSGLAAVVDGEVVGWCAVAPRASYAGLVRNGSMAAWSGRDEDRSDPDVWAVTCVLVRKGHRREGVATALVAGAVELARERGARRLEAYPMTQVSPTTSENHPGLLPMYEDAGFRVVHRPSKRRAVVAVELGDAADR